MSGIKGFGTGEAFFFNKSIFFLIKKCTFMEVSFTIDFINIICFAYFRYTMCKKNDYQSVRIDNLNNLDRIT
jgi:hypothetical protein